MLKMHLVEVEPLCKAKLLTLTYGKKLTRGFPLAVVMYRDAHWAILTMAIEVDWLKTLLSRVR